MDSYTRYRVIRNRSGEPQLAGFPVATTGIRSKLARVAGTSVDAASNSSVRRVRRGSTAREVGVGWG
jgi:hypothetical protein